jgi:hypothetical protein
VAPSRRNLPLKSADERKRSSRGATGVWMAHCHIAEHHESGMRFSFHVDP